MRKVLLIGLILAVLLLAFPQGVLAADVDVTANIVSSIEFEATNVMTDPVWELYAVAPDGPDNVATDAVEFEITSNTPFDLNVMEAGGEGSGDGNMASSDGSEELTNQIRVGDPSAWFTVTGEAITFLTGHEADTSGELVLHTDLAQLVDPEDDVRLVDDNYAITLTFECVPNGLGG